jgi:hypothetical protein
MAAAVRSVLLGLFQRPFGWLVRFPVHVQLPADLKKFHGPVCLWPTAFRETLFSTALRSCLEDKRCLRPAATLLTYWSEAHTCCIIGTMRATHLLRGVVFAALIAVAGSASLAEADELGKPLDWPLLVSKSAGIQFKLRTAWRDGALKYVATFSDEKGRIARYLSKLKGGPIFFSFNAGSPGRVAGLRRSTAKPS